MLNRSKEILVTGAAGFIGFAFVNRILESGLWSGWKVRVVDSLTYAADPAHVEFLKAQPSIQFFECDISDINLLSGHFGRPEYVVNFAAESHVDRSLQRPLKFTMSNVVGTANLLELSRQNGVKRFLQVSTDEVYGSVDVGSSTEEDLLNPSSPYSASKAAADLLALAYFRSFGLDVVVTRCCNNYGPGQNEEKFLPRVINGLRDGTDIPVYGEGKNVREWIHVRDHVAVLEQALLTGSPGEIYNVGSGESIDNLSLIKLAATVIGNKESIVHVEDRAGHDDRYCLNSKKAEIAFGYQHEHSLASYLREFVTGEDV